MTSEEILEFDRRHLWHPYSSMTHPLPCVDVKSAKGVHLRLRDGRSLIDGMSSWWCAIHGYNHPALNRAIRKQLESMSHVMFGGITHQPAAELGKRLISITPNPLETVFLADSGSVAVEVAIKMAIQYQHGRGKPEKKRLMTVRNGYHGDTFGAMSVCDPTTGMHRLFADTIAKQIFADAPPCRFGDGCTKPQFANFRRTLLRHRRDLAAVILEPIVQGAGGMQFYDPEFLRNVHTLCKEEGILLLLDEIATGFGRTGKLFACEHAKICPDILCVGKALTGGMLTLAATLTTREVAETVSAKNMPLMHGPTFMGNPLACAVAVASIDLLLNSPWQKRVQMIERHLRRGLEPLRAAPNVADVRCLGAIGVVEMHRPVDVAETQKRLMKSGVWLRPFGRLVYTMPPYVIRKPELDQITEAMRETIPALC
jgi:adenosylmethionine-8-amino-7-oxononanoate aminotransferase